MFEGDIGKTIKVQTNRFELLQTAVQVKIAHPMSWSEEVSGRGRPFRLPGIGGIHYNFGLGDSVFKLKTDHVEPDISTCATDDPEKLLDNPNLAVMDFACIGNTARVITGEDEPPKGIKGIKGWVIGHHGGVEHTFIRLKNPNLYMKELTYEDKFLIHAVGTGLTAKQKPEVQIHGIDPLLFEYFANYDPKTNKIIWPVVGWFPPEFMGSGSGDRGWRGDYDLQINDPHALTDYGPEDLKIGDFVALLDQDCVHWKGYRHEYLTIGVVVHGTCYQGGHGPGITPILSASTDHLDFHYLHLPAGQLRANIINYLEGKESA